MKTSWSMIASLALIAAGFALPALFYGDLPQRMPTHWNAPGQINGYMDKPLAAFLCPLLMLFTYILFRVLPDVSPEGYRMEPFARSYEWMQFGVLALLFVTHVGVLLSSLGYAFPMARAMGVAVGGLFMLIGNFMGKVTPNFFVGVRTPWTLSDPEVWLRTHRFGGKVFVVIGIVFAVVGLLNLRLDWFLAPILIASLSPVVYSYVLYFRRHPRQHDA